MMEGRFLTSLFGNCSCLLVTNNGFLPALKGTSNKPSFLLFPATLQAALEPVNPLSYNSPFEYRHFFPQNVNIQKESLENPSINTIAWLEIYGHCRKDQLCLEQIPENDIKIQGLSQCNSTGMHPPWFFPSDSNGAKLIQCFLSSQKGMACTLVV